MTTFIAFLRGINVGGKGLIKMERLREIFSKLGFGNVRTHINSGNVIFEAEGAPAKWIGKIEKALATELKRPVSVMVRTGADLKRLIAGNPFKKEKSIDHARLLVMFLSGAAPKDGMKKLGVIDSGDDRFHVAGSEVYLYCPNGVHESKLARMAYDKVFGVSATGRNWNTVNKLCELASAL